MSMLFTKQVNVTKKMQTQELDVTQHSSLREVISFDSKERVVVKSSEPSEQSVQRNSTTIIPWHKIPKITNLFTVMNVLLLIFILQASISIGTTFGVLFSAGESVRT